MSLPVKTGLPDALDLPAGYTIRFTALDPTTGALVSGVTVSAASILADSLGAGGEALTTGPFMLVPGPSA